MSANNAEVSSEALSGLQTDLTQLSNSLHEIFDLMSADMSQVGEAWRDGKYEEFVNGYRPQINKCEEISVRYHDWCTRILGPAIERVIAVEQTNVGGDGSGASVGGGSAAAGAGASEAAAVSSAKPSKVSGFNLTNKKTISKETTTCTTTGFSVLGNGGSTKTCVTEHGDGSKTTTVTSCTTGGLSASVGVAKGGFSREKCTTTKIKEEKS